MTDAGRDWSEEEDIFLEQKRKEGWSARRIAEGLKGRTRNAVIGRIHRMGLCGLITKPDRAARPQKPRVERRAAPAVDRLFAKGKAVSRLAVPGEPEPLMKPLEELGWRDCRWPFGDPQKDGFGFCGHPADGAGPYCAHHAKRSRTKWVPGMLLGVEA